MFIYAKHTYRMYYFDYDVFEAVLLVNNTEIIDAPTSSRTITLHLRIEMSLMILMRLAEYKYEGKFEHHLNSRRETTRDEYKTN